jgi:hypothetical protein
MVMSELEIEGVRYSIGTLSGLKQFHVFRKLLPLMSGMGATFARIAPALAQARRAAETNGAETSEQPTTPITQEQEVEFWSAIGPVAEALSNMTEVDTEYVLYTCLDAVTRRNSEGRWVRVTTGGKQLQFDDISMQGLLMLTFEVVRENMGGFFIEALRPNLEAGGSQQTSGSSQ